MLKIRRIKVKKNIECFQLIFQVMATVAVLHLSSTIDYQNCFKCAHDTWGGQPTCGSFYFWPFQSVPKVLDFCDNCSILLILLNSVETFTG
jgi:hypothetical protein